MWLYCVGCVACIIGISRDVINSNLSELVNNLNIDIKSTGTNLIGNGGVINNNATITIAKITALKKGKYLIIASALIHNVSIANIHQRIFINSSLTGGQTSTTIPADGWLKNSVVTFLDITTDNSTIEYKVNPQNSNVNVYDTSIYAIKLRS